MPLNPTETAILTTIDSMLPTIQQLGCNNLGATRVLGELLIYQPVDVAESLQHSIESHPDLRGPAIWVLYKDVCGQDIQCMTELIMNDTMLQAAVLQVQQVLR